MTFAVVSLVFALIALAAFIVMGVTGRRGGGR